MLLGAVLSISICASGATTALAVEPEMTSTSSSSPASQGNGSATYSAVLIVVTENGAEPINVSDSKLDLGSILRAKGYDASILTDSLGNPLQSTQKLKSGERFIVYGSTVEGTSETIELRLPDESTDDGELYKGETVVEDPGTVGSALKTTVTRRDLSKLSRKTDTKPEDLSAEALSSDAAKTSEESYITVLKAPTAKKIRVGTKECESEYLCELIKSGQYQDFKADGGWVHPLGGARSWTTYYGSKDHEGGAIDFPEPQGTPIYAVADGTVLNSANMGAGGNMATIRHDDGTITGYAHMVELPIVKVGEKVKAGQLIGFVGSTGRSTGPHLHFESWVDTVWGKQIPSYDYMKAHGVDLGSCTSGPCSLAEKDRVSDSSGSALQE